MKNEKLSQALKNYWRTLKYSDPEKYNSRVNQLKEANKKWRERKGKANDTFDDYDFTEYSDEDNDDIDSDELNDFEEASQNFETNKYTYKNEDAKYGFFSDETFIYNYFKEAYENPHRKGSKYIIEWVKYVEGLKFQQNGVEITGKELLADLVLESANAGKMLSRTETYELELAVNFCNALLDMWYRDGLLEGMFDNQDDLIDFMKATANAIVSYINEDEEFTYYD